MNWLVLALALVFAVATPVAAQDRPAAGINREQGTPGSAGPKTDGVVQRGQQPNAAEVRPGNRDGDAPSAAAGEVVARPETRIFGLPVTAALLLGGVLLTLLIVAGVAIPAARRRDRPRGGGTYGRPR
ncbi:MAG TPA: hypothetical protein VIE36_14085 [Methylomirabilota bacterium]|jgi:hypothetical protein